MIKKEINFILKLKKKNITIMDDNPVEENQNITTTKTRTSPARQSSSRGCFQWAHPQAYLSPAVHQTGLRVTTVSDGPQARHDVPVLR